MTASDPKKMLKQIEHKTAKANKFRKHNLGKKRTCGFTTKKCQRCGRIKGHLDQYRLDLCRQCFRDVAIKIGFKKYN
jgi:small subunit ribosomal protein S14